MRELLAMHPLINEKQADYEAVIDHLKKELATLRTGQASPALVEDIPVSAYDSTMEIKGLASISTQDTKTIIIDPWDKGLLQAIEKGIRDADIGISPVVDGTVIRIVLPMMTEENRVKLVKVVKEKLEEARVGLRKVREAIREDVIKQEKEKEISEDEKFKLFDEVEKSTKEFMAKVEELGEKKEHEIMTI